MTTLLTEARGLRAPARLVVDRGDIHFEEVAPGRVAVSVRVRNDGDAPSGPTTAVLSAAPFGAFVAWRPLATLAVPALEAGEAAELRTEALRARPRPLGPPDRVPPRRLLTALASDDGRPRRGLVVGQAPRSADATRELPLDLGDLLGRGNPHWAGNLNVFVGHRAVERHLARAVRIEPGRTNVAFFIVGSEPDAYTFDVTGAGRGWDVALFDATSARSLSLGIRDGRRITPRGWIEMPGQQMMVLALVPPSSCGPAEVAVHVSRRSTGEVAVVEFSFDPRAAGPGCYTIG